MTEASSIDWHRGVHLPPCPSPRIVIFPHGERGYRCLQRLLTDRQSIVGVALGEHTGSATLALCASAGLPTHLLQASEKLSAAPTLDFLRQLDPDLVVLSGFDRILPASVRAVARVCTLNLHGGRLPEYRGASVMQWQIINGEQEGGCTIHVVDDGIDTGPIVAQELVAIPRDMTGGEFVSCTLEVFPRLLSDVIHRIAAGTAELHPQDETRATYYCKRYPEYNIIRWNAMTAAQVHNLVRALSGRSIPSAFTYCDGRRVGIYRTCIPERRVAGLPGRVVLTPPEGALVMCADRAILVCEAEASLLRGQQFEDRA